MEVIVVHGADPGLEQHLRGAQPQRPRHTSAFCLLQQPLAQRCRDEDALHAKLGVGQQRFDQRPIAGVIEVR